MTNTFIIAFASFIIGNITGYFISRILLHNTFKFDNDGRINYLIGVVSIIWFISVLYDMINPLYETSPLIHGIMGAIVGFFFWKPKL